MAVRGNIDEASEFCIRGWASDEAFPDRQIEVQFLINGSLAASTVASIFRADLLEAGIGDGRKAFCFNPQDYWTGLRNHLQVSDAEAGLVLSGGMRTVSASPLHADDRARDTRLRAARGHLDGASLLDHVDRLFPWTPETSILEVDPVYGELLAAMVERQKPVGRYLGVELARDRSEDLNMRFRQSGARFRTGDADRYPYPQAFDLILAGATLDRRYPSCAAVLRHVARTMTPGGMLFADFGTEDESLSTSRAFFDAVGAFTRVYCESQLRSMFGGAGLAVVELQRPFADGRVLVCARK